MRIEPMRTVQASAAFIAENSKYVQLHREKCAEVAREINSRMTKQQYSPATWSSHPLNPNASTPHVIDWIFTVDTLNFSFWQDEPRFTVDYRGQTWTGYWSLVAAINRALDEGIPITTPTYWLSSDFTREKLAHVFRSTNDVSVPLFEERYQALKQAGEALQQFGFTSFENVLQQTHESAQKTIEWLATNIKSYDDRAVFEGQEVLIMKRAQILVADLWACGVAKFTDIDTITMFADYRVPQMLVVLGCISYSDELRTKIQGKQIINAGSREEVEIRGCSIMAVELIVEAIKKLGSTQINAVLADFYLWDTAKEEEAVNTQKVECHRTRSWFY